MVLHSKRQANNGTDHNLVSTGENGRALRYLRGSENEKLTNKYIGLFSNSVDTSFSKTVAHVSHANKGSPEVNNK